MNMHLCLRMNLCMFVGFIYVFTQVDFSDVLRVSAQDEQKWQLKVLSILASQNASLGEAVMVWKRTLDTHFGGATECTICYAVVHGPTRSLPRLHCKQCKNKFHSACLFKWFSSSGKSNCPLCRHIF